MAQGVPSFFAQLEAQRAMGQSPMPATGAFGNPFALGQYFSQNPEALAKYNQALAPYGVAFPSQLPQHPIFHQLDEAHPHGFIGRHPRLFGGIENALLGAALTPAGNPVEGAGEGFARAIQGALGIRPYKEAYAGRVLQAPLAAAQQAQGLQLGQSVVGAERTGQQVSGAEAGLDTATANLRNAQAHNLKPPVQPIRMGDVVAMPGANGTWSLTSDYGAMTPMYVRRGNQTLPVYPGINGGSAMTLGANGTMVPFDLQPKDTFLPRSTGGEAGLALTDPQALALLGRVLAGVRATPTTSTTTSTHTTTPAPSAPKTTAEAAYYAALKAYPNSKAAQLAITMGTTPQQLAANAAAYATKVSGYTPGANTPTAPAQAPKSAPAGATIPAASVRIKAHGDTTGVSWNGKAWAPTRLTAQGWVWAKPRK